jgi:hypothetical protein
MQYIFSTWKRQLTVGEARYCFGVSGLCGSRGAPAGCVAHSAHAAWRQMDGAIRRGQRPFPGSMMPWVEAENACRFVRIRLTLDHARQILVVAI